MIPLKDINPTTRPPVVTLILILICGAAWMGWQQEPQRSDVEDLVFNLEHAAIPCELVHARPLTVPEVEAAFGTLGGDTESCGIGGEAAIRAVPGKSPWLAILASMFMHAGIAHIAANMLFLWIFANNIEDRVGHVRFVVFYLAGGIVATLGHVALNPESVVPLVGASGAVAAVMGVYFVWFPRAPVRTVVFIGLPLLATISAKWVLSIWFVMQFLTSPNSGVAWAAHVAGFVFGVAVAVPIRLSRAAQRLAWTRDHIDDMDPHHWDPTGGAGDARLHEPTRLRRRSG